MKRILMIVGLVITLSNVGLGIAYACTCTDAFGGCTGSGKGALCFHNEQGRCVCQDGILQVEQSEN